MTLEKSKLKALMAQGFAADLFKSRDAFLKAIDNHKGAAEAFSKAKEHLSALSQGVRNELIKNGLPFDPNDPVDVGKWVVDKFMKAANEFHKLAEAEAASSLRSEGQYAGVLLAIDNLTKVADEENAKVSAAQHAFSDGRLTDGGDGDMLLSSGPGAARMPGQHPGPPMKAQRQGSLPLDAHSQDPPEEPAEKAVETEEPAKKPARKTRKTAKPKSKAAAKPRAKKTPARVKKAADAKDT